MRFGCYNEAQEAFRSALTAGKEIGQDMVQAAFTNGGSLPKELIMMHWSQLAPDQDIIAHMDPLPANADGSTYGTDSIRIGGSAEFVDAVLSRLKDLIHLENGRTRLAVSRSKVKPKDIGGKVKGFANASHSAECVYIHARERGPGAHAAYAFCGIVGLEDRPKLETCAHTAPLFE